MNENTPAIRPPTGNPFARAASSDVNQGTIDIESSRAIAEAQGKLVIAKKFPRDKARAYEQVMETCSRLSFAEDATYSLPRGKEPVAGPSIRLAEAVARAWGNVDFGIRELSRKTGDAPGEGYSEMQVYCWDLETNVQSVQNFTVRHWRDTRDGGRPLRDETELYEVTASQAGRRLRSRILAIVPNDLVDAAVAACSDTIAKGGGEPLADRIRKMLKAFSRLGVTASMLETYLGHKLDDMLPEEFGKLQQIHASLKDGMSTAGQWFAAPAGSQARTRPVATGSDGDLGPVDAGTPQASEPANPGPQAAPEPANAGANVASEPPATVPTLEQRRSGFLSALEGAGFREDDFWDAIDKNPAWGFPPEAQSIATFDETAMAFCSKKWVRTILPALKAAKPAAQ